MESLLAGINSPDDLKKIPVGELPRLAQEIRDEIVRVICGTGGHLASSLGAVELTIALHYLLKTPQDAIFWDVGHQAYAHKLLTGRRERFDTIRQMGGISGFPNKYESPHDPFTVGHSSTSISTALGFCAARDLAARHDKVVVVIGDAALAGGMAFEALNHAGHLKKELIVILNDNEFSISPTIGALSKYLNRIITNPLYNRVRHNAEALLKKLPRVGEQASRAARRFEEGLKNIITEGIIFEEMGFRYFGPIDGHDIDMLLEMLTKVSSMPGPILIHVVTKKGKGYKHAEECPVRFHSASPFEIDSGAKKVIADGEVQFVKGKTYTDVFGAHLSELAKTNEKLTAITAAMPDGTGLTEFAKLYPARFFDVGIAEQHGVGFAAGLARGGYRPFVAIYSTFLQRAYDQIVHDVALQGLPVAFCVDRAGLVGEDGPTHHGLFDLAYLRSIPGMSVLAPSDTDELKLMLDFMIGHDAPVAVRYPRGAEVAYMERRPHTRVELGKAEVIREGNDACILALGSMVWLGAAAAKVLEKDGIKVTLVNARFAKPLDALLLGALAKRMRTFVTLEEGVIEGGFGSAVLEFFESKKIAGVTVRRIGLPSAFIEHGSREELFTIYGLTPEAIATVLKEAIR